MVVTHADENEPVDSSGHAREFFIRHQARYEVSQYFVIADDRTYGRPPIQRRIPAGFDLDLYAAGPNHGSMLSFQDGELRKTLDELSAACAEAIAHVSENSRVDILLFEGTLILDVKRHFEPEALVRIRISHFRGVDQPAGASEDEVRTHLEERLRSLGVKRT